MDLGMQPIHLGLPLILGYSFTKKIKHISRINASDKYKIAINSPEMHLGIKRQYAEVGHRNIIIFSYKSHLDIFCINREQFI
jgi:predicted NUDIX family NTP pyrophosphohydrolase